MKRSKHAQEIAERFGELMEDAGDSLSRGHRDELALLIEAGIDSALLDMMGKVADKLDEMSRAVRHDAEFFE